VSPEYFEEFVQAQVDDEVESWGGYENVDWDLLGDESNFYDYRLKAAVEQADHDEAVAQRDAENAEVYRIMRGESEAVYHEALKELVDVDDAESRTLYHHLKGWVGEAGYDLDALVEAGKGAEAARHLRSAYGQHTAHLRAEQDDEIRHSIMD